MPVLYVVSTPIGNLSDLSPRALEILKNVDGVFCEDTRHTLSLLSHFNLKQKLYRLDQHSTERDIRHYCEVIKSSHSMAIVSDAGTPAVSDPGSELVNECLNQGIVVSPVPGASAVTALLSVSGFGGNHWAFRGFFPRKQSDRLDEIRQVLTQDMASVILWFESPQRVSDTLELFSHQCPGAQMVAGKELTKKFEKILKKLIRRVYSA